MKTSLLTLALLAASAVWSLAKPEIGRPAPDFTATDSTGRTHSLTDFRGKIVVLEWLNHGCPFVKKHYGSGNMQKLQKAATDQGVVWLSVVSSAPGKQGHMSAAEAEAKRAEVGSAATAVLLDESGTVGRAYGARTTPEIFVINAEGILVYMGAIDDTPGTDPAEVATAKNHVTATLDALATGKPVQPAQTQPYGCSVKY